MADGLSAAQAARAIGVARATLYRWEKDAEPKSRRPKRTRAKIWTSALVEAVEHLRLDFPMWGGAKLGPPLRTESFKVSQVAPNRRSLRAERPREGMSPGANLVIDR
jgi:putative transposase